MRYNVMLVYFGFDDTYIIKRTMLTSDLYKKIYKNNEWSKNETPKKSNWGLIIDDVGEPVSV